MTLCSEYSLQTIQLPLEVAQQEDIQPVVVASQQQDGHQQQHIQQHQPTTVIIRKDVLSFNFSDIERPDSSSISDTGRNLLLRGLSQRSVTATPKPPITELDDIFISVKTTKNYHDTRLALIIKTWFQLARDQVSLDKLFRSYFTWQAIIHVG